MKFGSSQCEITPQPGVELCGFAARLQPSTGVLDPLYAKAFFLVAEAAKLLWLHCDLIGFEPDIVRRFRDWAGNELGLSEAEVMLSATHTHAGPGTIHLREAGDYDPVYVDFLLAQLQASARAAMARLEDCAVCAVEARLELAVDRRGTASAHTDPRVAALGFRRADGSFAGVILNYAMHPVALGAGNRLVSADTAGQVAVALASQLASKPIIFVTNGACANLNPPEHEVAFSRLSEWGHQIASSVSGLLENASVNTDEHLSVIRRIVQLPLDVLDAEEVDEFAAAALRDANSLSQWGDKYRCAVEHWRQTVVRHDLEHGNGYHPVELFGVSIGGIVLLGVNAEVFSNFVDLLRCDHALKVYPVSYANGVLGYLPTRAAYAEGGYEVETAHLFYGGFRPKLGGLEMLAAAASELVAELR